MSSEENKKDANQKRRKLSSFQENLILFLLFLFIFSLFSLSVYAVWRKIKPPPQERKASIVSLPKAEKASQNEDGGKEEAFLKTEPEKNSETEKKENSAEIEILVLNGGAPSGSAKKMTEVLIKAGYSKVKAENAKKSDYKGVTVFYEKEFLPEAQKIVQLLKSYDNKAKAEENKNLGEAKGDLIIILGS